MNPTKSCCQSYNASSKVDKGVELIMAGDRISCDRCTVHLGITRDTREKVNIEEKLSIGRDCIFPYGGGVPQWKWAEDLSKWSYLVCICGPKGDVWPGNPVP